MTLGASLYPWLWRDSVVAGVRCLVGAGFDAIEVVAGPPHLSSSAVAERRQLPRVLDGLGATVVAVNVPTMDVNLAAADADMRELSTRRYAEAIEAAGELGAPRVVVCAGKRHPLIPAPVGRARAWSVAALQRLVARADAAGVGLCLENLPYGLCETVAELRGLAEEVDGRVEVMVDTANAHMVEPVAAAFAAHPRVGYVHVSDTTRAAWRHDELGAGEVDVATVADALARTGATAVLELVAADPLAALERSRALLRAHGVGTAATSTNQMTNQT